MKKNIIILLVLFAVIALTVSASFESEKGVVKFGEYEVSEKILCKYMLLSTIQNDDSVSCATAAKLYAKNQIALDEIANTAYDIPTSYKQELIKNETENFDRDYQKNLDFCEKNGISRQELIDITVQSKMDIMIKGNHFSKVINEFLAGKNDGIAEKTKYSPDELLAVYDQHMAAKMDKMEYKMLDDKIVQALEKSVPVLDIDDGLFVN